MTKRQSLDANFGSVLKADVPHGRNGKHKKVVVKILSDLEHLGPGRALKIPLTQLSDSKENVRSALNRATRQRGLNVATASDDEYLYIWVADQNDSSVTTKR